MVFSPMDNAETTPIKALRREHQYQQVTIATSAEIAGLLHGSYS